MKMLNGCLTDERVSLEQSTFGEATDLWLSQLGVARS